MIHFRMIGAAVIALAASAGAAAAADVGAAPPPVYVPPPVPVDTFTWQGAYAGALIGYGWGDFSDEVGNSVDVDGFVAGGFVGYNADLGNFVVGGEVDAVWSNIEGANAALGATADLNALGTARVRAGYDLGRVLVYGTGGLAVGQAEIDGGGGPITNTHWGWTVGAGVDVAVTDNIFARVEYKYVDLGRENYGGGTNIDFDANVITGGVGFRF